MQLISGSSDARRPIPDLGCACATLRRAARAVSQIYADEFEGILEGPQFSLLRVLSKRPGSNQAEAGRILLLDKTTMSRNLSVLKRNGWIEATRTDDRRERGYELTEAGRELMKRAGPAWHRAQKRLRTALGEAGWDRLFDVANTVTRQASELNEAAAAQNGSGTRSDKAKK